MDRRAFTVSNHVTDRVRSSFDCGRVADAVIRERVLDGIADAYEVLEVVTDKLRPYDGPSTVYLTDELGAFIVRPHRHDPRRRVIVHTLSVAAAMRFVANGEWILANGDPS